MMREYFKRIFKKQREEKPIKKNSCLTCKFNQGLYCSVGDVKFNQICFEGELWELDETLNENKDDNT